MNAKGMDRGSGERRWCRDRIRLSTVITVCRSDAPSPRAVAARSR
jgi:hypothetical protein